MLEISTIIGAATECAAFAVEGGISTKVVAHSWESRNWVTQLWADHVAPFPRD
jgi:hypothetical protein